MEQSLNLGCYSSKGLSNGADFEPVLLDGSVFEPVLLQVQETK